MTHTEAATAAAAEAEKKRFSLCCSFIHFFVSFGVNLEIDRMNLSYVWTSFSVDLFTVCEPVKCRIKHTRTHTHSTAKHNFFVFIFIFITRTYTTETTTTLTAWLLCNLAFSRFKICAPFFLLHIYRYQWVSVEQHMAQISYYYCY